MPENSLAKKAVTNFAVKATAPILTRVAGNALGGGELSKVTTSICDTIKTVTCKDRIVMEQAIKAQALIDETVYDQFLSLLNDAIQVYVRSDCKDYSIAMEAVFHDVSAPLEEKVKYAKELKKQQHEHLLEMLKVVGNQVSKIAIAVAVTGIGNKIAGQTPLIAEKLNEADKRHLNAKREQEREAANLKRQKANLEQERERARIEQERRRADFEREEARKKADFAREQERKRFEAEQRAKAQNK